MSSRVRTDILWPGSRLLIAHNANAYPSVTQASPPAPPPPRTDTCQIFRITTFCPLRGIIIERFVLVCVCVPSRRVHLPLPRFPRAPLGRALQLARQLWLVALAAVFPCN